VTSPITEPALAGAAASFITAATTIFVAELGDKTQLFAMALAARTHRPWTVLAGVGLGALVLMVPAAWLGAAAANLIDPTLTRYISAALFFAFGAWLFLRGADDEDDDPDAAAKLRAATAWAVFTSAAVGFALAELGDKSQIAVVLLGTRTDHVWAVIGGAWMGEMLAIAPAALLGRAIAARVSAKTIGKLAALLFVGLGVATLLGW
jgi:putative Ca2+/H+ antiporter (TMEM165/GDT1 family)